MISLASSYPLNYHALKSAVRNVQHNMNCVSQVVEVQIMQFSAEDVGNRRPIVLAVGSNGKAKVVLTKI